MTVPADFKPHIAETADREELAKRLCDRAIDTQYPLFGLVYRPPIGTYRFFELCVPWHEHPSPRVVLNALYGDVERVAETFTMIVKKTGFDLVGFGYASPAWAAPNTAENPLTCRPSEHPDRYLVFTGIYQDHTGAAWTHHSLRDGTMSATKGHLKDIFDGLSRSITITRERVA